MKTLNSNQRRRRLQLHVCPLQLEVVERLIGRYTAKGEIVFDPFAGLFTVPERAVRMGRIGYGVELNENYFRDGLGYLKLAEEEFMAPTLFDYLEINETEAAV